MNRDMPVMVGDVPKGRKEDGFGRGRGGCVEMLGSNVECMGGVRK